MVEYKAIIEKTLADNTASQDAFYTACNSILESLQKELQSDNLIPEEKERIENKMLEVAKMIGEKDSEKKQQSAAKKAEKAVEKAVKKDKGQEL